MLSKNHYFGKITAKNLSMTFHQQLNNTKFQFYFLIISKKFSWYIPIFLLKLLDEVTVTVSRKGEKACHLNILDIFISRKEATGSRISDIADREKCIVKSTRL